MNRLWGLLLFILLSLGVKGGGNDTIIFNTKTVLHLSNNICIYKDNGGGLSFNDVSNASFINNFTPAKAGTFFENSEGASYWVCFSINNNTGEDIALMVDYPMLDTVQYYGINRAGTVDSFYSGSSFHYDQRQIDYNRIAFEIHPDVKTVYLRISSSFNIQFPLTIYSFDKLNEAIGKDNFYQGFYFGLVILIAIYSLFVFISFRDKIYIYYFLHVLVTGLIMAYISGYGFQILWPGLPIINRLEPTIFSLSVVSLFFSMRFLETKKNTPTLHKWYCAAIVLTLIAMPLNLFGFNYYATKVVQAATICNSVLILLTGILLLRRGYWPARHFTFAWSFLLLGIIITLVQRFGLLPYKWYYTYAWQIGSAFDITFLSLAVAERINMLREEAEQSHKSALEQTRRNKSLVIEQNAILTQKVQKRTAQLEDKNIELEKLNNTKDKLFSIVAHDLKGPMGNIQKFIELMIEDENMRDDETLIMLQSSAANTYNLLESLLTWARTQRGEIDFRPERLNLREISSYPADLLKLQMHNKSISFENHIAEDIYVSADTPILRTVMRNIMSNAIKFTKNGGTISINAKRMENNKIKVSITDTGVGIDKERLKTLFEPVKNKNTKGTGGEKGTGLGLLITAEFVELSEGEISAESTIGQGTTISFTLPAA